MRNLTLSVSALLALCGSARAEQTPADRPIGGATLIEKIVEGLTAERNMRLKVGDAVFFNELLTTGQASNGKFVFDDRATLQMGPQSQVRLDNFVYANDSGGAPGVAFNITKGALRFMSAPGNHKPYEVRTRNASIGVRGTAFAVRSTELRTDAVLYEGAIEVCLPNGGACRTLDKPCTIVAVTLTGFSETRDVGAKDWSFDDSCRPKPAPAPRRRHGAAEPPASAPPPVVAPRRAAAAPPPPRKMRVAHVEPPPADYVRPRPPRATSASSEPVRPRWPRRPPRPPVYEPDDDAPDYPPPRVVRFPLHPPVIFGGGPFRPRFPGGWGGRFPQGSYGGGYGGFRRY